MRGSGDNDEDQDDEEEEEEEELLVHVEFDGLLDSNILDRPNLFFKVVGIDTDRPVMQIEEQVYTGEYRDVVGTALFFEEDPCPKSDDPVFGKVQGGQLRYICKTRKSVLMSRVFLKRKGEEANDDLVSEEENPRLHKANNGETPADASDERGASANSSVYVENPKDPVPKEVRVSKEDEARRNVPKSCPRSVDMEPVAGPSWAPDIPDLQLQPDHMSRLIAEQMTIASDINMQNSLYSGENSD